MKLYVIKYLLINVLLFYILRFCASLASFANGLIEGEYPLSPFMEIALIIQLSFIGLLFYKNRKNKKGSIHLYLAILIILLFLGRYYGIISNYYMP